MSYKLSIIVKFIILEKQETRNKKIKILQFFMNYNIMQSNENENEIPIAKINSSVLISQNDPRKIKDNRDFTVYLTLQRVSAKMQTDNKYSQSSKAKIIRKWYKKTRYLRIIVLTIYVMIKFFQKPGWCDDTYRGKIYFFINDSCSYDSKGFRVSTSNIVYMPDSLFISLDVLSISILWAGNIAKMTILKNKVDFQFIMKSFLYIGTIIESIIMDRSFNFSALFTPFVLILNSKRVQVQFNHLWQVFRSGKEIFYFMILTLVFFTCLGKVIFSKTAINPIFGSGIFEIMKQLFILQTTVNSPDVYLEYYGQSYWASLYFISYQFINTTLILNMIIVIFYTQYKQNISNETERILNNPNQKIEQIFSQYIVKRSKSYGTLTAQDFSDIRLSQYDSLNHIINSLIYELFIDLICTFILAGIFQELDGLWGVINISLNTLLLVEEIILFQLLGWHNIMNRKSLFIGLIQSVSILVLQIVILNQNTPQVELILKLFMCFRLFRISTILLKSEQFTLLVLNLIKLLPYLLDLFSALIILFLFFSALGQILFGGHITYEIAETLKLNGISENYVYISFNDLISGLITCWALLVINNWNLISSMFCLVMHNDAYILFFISYYIIVVLITLNLTIAILIDYLVQKKQDLGSAEKKENSD
ncbi:hypothetical protein pb186bvf_003841 [Paramecium bursaria]